MSDIRIGATTAFERVRDDDAILVCAYDDESKCRNLRIGESYTFGEFRERQEELSRDLEVIFYCA